MKGLIIKDFLTFKSTFWAMLVISAIFCIIGITSQNDFLITFNAVYFSISITTAMSWDEKSNFNHFVGVMPVKKIDVVISKYILGAILSIISIAYCAIASIFLHADIIESITAAALISVAYQCFTIPIIFKFGIEKSRLISMVIYFGIFAIILGVNLLVFESNFFIFTNDFNILNSVMRILITLLILAVIYMASIMISFSIYKKKDW